MNKSILLISLLVLCGVNCVSAQKQKYPSTDASGAKVYYKIASAYPEYSQMCIEDNSLRASSNGYSFWVNEISDNTKQEWELVVSTDGEKNYYFRNRSSRRYIVARVLGKIITILRMPQRFVQQSSRLPFRNWTTTRLLLNIMTVMAIVIFLLPIRQECSLALMFTDLRIPYGLGKFAMQPVYLFR